MRCFECVADIPKGLCSNCFLEGKRVAGTHHVVTLHRKYPTMVCDAHYKSHTWRFERVKAGKL